MSADRTDATVEPHTQEGSSHALYRQMGWVFAGADRREWKPAGGHRHGPFGPASSPALISVNSQPPSNPLTPALRTQILAAMRLNRQAFQEDAVLSRYSESRPASSLAAYVVRMPRTASGAPASQVSSRAGADDTARVYPETKVADCLSTTGGLSGTRASPWRSTTTAACPGSRRTSAAASPSSCACRASRERAAPGKMAFSSMGRSSRSRRDGSSSVPTRRKCPTFRQRSTTASSMAGRTC